MENMKHIKRILTAEMYASIAVSLVIVILFETDVLLPGVLADNTTDEFLTVSCMEIITVCMIPLALRLFRFCKVSSELKSGHRQALVKWGSLRMAMLCVPMMANTLMYYLYGFNVAFSYMGIICLICLPLIYPSTSRCANETGMQE